MPNLDLATKPPSELRKEILALREQLEAAQQAASEAQQQVVQATEALDAERRERAECERAHEARFDDMRDFMEGLLKGLKAENANLKSQVEQQQR